MEVGQGHGLGLVPMANQTIFPHEGTLYPMPSPTVVLKRQHNISPGPGSRKTHKGKKTVKLSPSGSGARGMSRHELDVLYPRQPVSTKSSKFSNFSRYSLTVPATSQLEVIE